MIAVHHSDCVEHQPCLGKDLMSHVVLLATLFIYSFSVKVLPSQYYIVLNATTSINGLIVIKVI
jgi:hypothetical protein